MQQLVRLNIILLTIFILRSDASGIRISGSSSSYTYDPRNPGSGFRLACLQDNVGITSATWTRDGEPVEDGLVQGNGRLALNSGTIDTEDPQRFEGLYRCHSGSDTSNPVAFFGKTSFFLNTTTVIINASYSGTKAQ